MTRVGRFYISCACGAPTATIGTPRCRSCNREYMRRFRQDPEHREAQNLAGREWRQRNLAHARQVNRKWATNNPEKKSAHGKLEWAVKVGRVVRQPCKCGNPKTEAHHEDYSRPLEVAWLCRSCHRNLHLARKAS